MAEIRASAGSSSMTSDTMLGYFHCQTEQQNFLNGIALFESLNKQILIHLFEKAKELPGSLLREILNLYTHENPQKDSNDVVKLFSTLTDYLPQLLLVIDGLDEFKVKDQRLVLSTFEALVQMHDLAKVFIASREHLHSDIDIFGYLKELVHFRIEPIHNSSDVNAYINKIFERKMACDRQLTDNKLLAQEVKNTIQRKASGM